MDSCPVLKPFNQATRIFSMLYILCILGANTAVSQTVNTPPTSSTNSTGLNFTMVVILVTLIIIFCLVVLSTICVSNRAFGNRPFSSFTSNTTFNIPVFTFSPRTAHGLDRNVLDTFPIMKYTELMELKHSKNPLECQVCQSEFSDHDMLRLIPGCCHLFHPTCIDAWLTRNVHCPICRSDLTKAAMVSVNNTSAPLQSSGNNQNHDNMSQQDLMEMPLKRFMLKLPVHLTEEIQVSEAHRLSASIAGSPYAVTAGSKSGRLWSFTRTYSNRNRNSFTGEMSRSFSIGSQPERSVSAPVLHDPV